MLWLVQGGVASRWLGGSPPGGPRRDWAILSASDETQAIDRWRERQARNRALGQLDELEKAEGDTNRYQCHDPNCQDPGCVCRGERAYPPEPSEAPEPEPTTPQAIGGYNVDPAVASKAAELCVAIESWLEQAGEAKYVRISREKLAEAFATADYIATALEGEAT